MENKKRGWIKLYRSMMDGPGYFTEPFCRNMAWVDLILLANFDSGFFRVRGIKVDIVRGQVGHGIETLAGRWKWSRGKVERFLNELEEDEQIVRQKNNVTTLITILNYEEYQNNDNADDKANEHQNISQTGIDEAKNVGNDDVHVVRQNSLISDCITKEIKYIAVDNDNADSKTDGQQTVKQTVKQTSIRKEERKNTKNVKKRKKDVEPVSPLLIKFCHDGEEFKKTYLDWIDHLDKKKKTPTETTIIYQMKFLENYDEQTAIEILKYSLKGGYPQLYEPKNINNATSKNRTAESISNILS